jgi:hypothetical protein
MTEKPGREDDWFSHEYLCINELCSDWTSVFMNIQYLNFALLWSDDKAAVHLLTEAQQA